MYETKTFDLPTLEGISDKEIKMHLGLYEGYVKHTNHLQEQINELAQLDKDKYAYAITELRRRLGFEFNGMRMHEYYFEQFEGGPKAVNQESMIAQLVSIKYGSWEDFIQHFSEVGMSRGIGWTILYHDLEQSTVHTAWVSDHELGQLGGTSVVLAMDMWEHAFMVDYLPSEKKQYIEAFLKNINWEVVGDRM